jgi:hypothetical protein
VDEAERAALEAWLVRETQIQADANLKHPRPWLKDTRPLTVF